MKQKNVTYKSILKEFDLSNFLANAKNAALNAAGDTAEYVSKPSELTGYTQAQRDAIRLAAKIDPSMTRSKELLVKGIMSYDDAVGKYGLAPVAFLTFLALIGTPIVIVLILKIIVTLYRALIRTLENSGNRTPETQRAAKSKSLQHGIKLLKFTLSKTKSPKLQQKLISQIKEIEAKLASA